MHGVPWAGGMSRGRACSCSGTELCVNIGAGAVHFFSFSSVTLDHFYVTSRGDVSKTTNLSMLCERLIG